MLTLFQLYLSAMSSPQPAKTQNKQEGWQELLLQWAGKGSCICTHTWLKMGKFLETWTPANCTRVRGAAAESPCPSLGLDKIRAVQAAPPAPHTVPLVPGLHRWAVPTQPSAEMLKFRCPWRKPCQEQAAGAAPGRQEQQWKKDTKLQIWRATPPKQGV